MDSFLHIGYRIDLPPKAGVMGYELKFPNVSDSFDFDKEWWYWPQHGKQIYVYMGGDLPSYYKCPFGHETLWSELNSDSHDLPINHEENVEKIKDSSLFKGLAEIYDENTMEVKYGIFKGLG